MCESRGRESDRDPTRGDNYVYRQKPHKKNYKRENIKKKKKYRERDRERARDREREREREREHFTTFICCTHP
jgi:hypothetical protein